MSKHKRELLADILIQEGILTPKDLKELIQRQRRQPPEAREPIGRLAVRYGHLDESRLQALLNEHGSRLHLGELLVLRGHISVSQLAEALRAQVDETDRLGEILLKLKYLDPSALVEGLAEQKRVPFIPIRSIPVDPRLEKWVNRCFSESHGVVPLVLRGRDLVVAVSDPEAFSCLAEIEQCTGQRVLVVMTTHAELKERSERLYGPRPRPREAA